MAEVVEKEPASQCAPRAERFPEEAVTASNGSNEGAIKDPAGHCASEAVRFPEGRALSDEPARRKG